MNITIRTARPEDAAVIADFNTRLAAETESKTLDSATIRAGVVALLADPSKGRYFVAESEGKIIGQTAVSFEWSDWRNGMIWWLQSVYVCAEFRAKGVFRALFNSIRLTALQEGVIGIRLYVDEENRRGQSAYRSLGMERLRYQVFEVMLQTV